MKQMEKLSLLPLGQNGRKCVSLPENFLAGGGLPWGPASSRQVPCFWSAGYGTPPLQSIEIKFDPFNHPWGWLKSPGLLGVSFTWKNLLTLPSPLEKALLNNLATWNPRSTAREIISQGWTALSGHPRSASPEQHMGQGLPPSPKTPTATPPPMT